MNWISEYLSQDCRHVTLVWQVEFSVQIVLFCLHVTAIWQGIIALTYMQNWYNKRENSQELKCPCCFMYLMIILCKNTLRKSALFLPALEYDSLHLRLHSFFTLIQYRNKIPFVLWEDWQSGLYNLESDCSFLELVELKMHHVQDDFTPLLAWKVFL